MPATQPSPSTFVLLCKNGKTTVILHVNSQQTLQTVREELLKALKEANPDGKFNGCTIPNNADEIRFAVPMKSDHDNAWLPLELCPDDFHIAGTTMSSDKRNGKRPVGSNATKPPKKTVQDAALHDGSFVAFKFAKKDADGAEVPKIGKEDDDFAVDIEQWHVEWPEPDDEEEN